MRQRLRSITLDQALVVLGKLISILFVGGLFVALLLLPLIASSLGVRNIPQRPFSWPNLQTIQQSPATSTNGNPGSSQTPQVQEILTESQNNVTIANAVVTFTGIFVTIIVVVIAVASFFGISEVVKIRELRVKHELELKETKDSAQQSKDLINTIIQDSQSQFDKIINHTTDVENELKLLDKRIELESQKFIEAAYYYSEGSKLYISGDNHHAIEFYLRALKLLPRSLTILERLGRAYSNLNDTENAVYYLNQALAINPEDETALRSLSLLFRSTEPEKAIVSLKEIVHKNPGAFEAWDFLGLCYRDQLIRNDELIKDQTLIDEAINAHERALAIKKRPETEFYLGILLYYSPKGDKIRAKELLSSAYSGTLLQEHDLRIRQVWKILMHVGALITTDEKVEALRVFKTLKEYITTKRIREGVEMHLRFLLEGIGHQDWLPDFLAVMR